MKRLVIACLLVIAGCYHHHGGGGFAPPASSPNPALAKYHAHAVAEHRPGFFSAIWHNHELKVGTYQEYKDGRGQMVAELCALRNGRVVVLHKFHGESIYNLRQIDSTAVFCAVEQGALWGYRDDGSTWVIHPQHLRMGHYDVQWWNGKWVTSEKDTITTHNKSQLWINGNLLYEATDFTWKEFVLGQNKAYIATYFVWKRTEAGLLEVDLNTGKPNLVYSVRWGQYSIVGRHKGKIYYGIQFGNRTKIFMYPNVFIQEIDSIGWRFREVGDTFFLTGASHGWRKEGPSYLYVMDEATGKFVKVLEIPDAEPWDIVRGAISDTFYLVTRNEKLGNLGRIYEITREW